MRERVLKKKQTDFSSYPPDQRCHPRPLPRTEKQRPQTVYRKSFCTVFWDHSVWFGKQSDKKAPYKSQTPH